MGFMKNPAQIGSKPTSHEKNSIKTKNKQHPCLFFVFIDFFSWDVGLEPIWTRPPDAPIRTRGSDPPWVWYRLTFLSSNHCFTV